MIVPSAATPSPASRTRAAWFRFPKLHGSKLAPTAVTEPRHCRTAVA